MRVCLCVRVYMNKFGSSEANGNSLSLNTINISSTARTTSVRGTKGFCSSRCFIVTNKIPNSLPSISPYFIQVDKKVAELLWIIL